MTIKRERALAAVEPLSLLYGSISHQLQSSRDTMPMPETFSNRIDGVPLDGSAAVHEGAFNPKLSHLSNIRSRTISEHDLFAVANLLGDGLDYDSRFYLHVLTCLIKHPTPNGFPKYGYLLEHDGRLVGAILLIFTRLQIGQETTLRCHVTNWYVKPNYRAYAALFFIKALGHKDVNYLNISALPAAQPILDIQGFSKYSRGQFFALPALHLMSGSADARIINVNSVPDVPFKAFERELLLDHAKYGCISFWCATQEEAFPFVFRTHLTKKLWPDVRLIYCRDVQDLVRFARPIGLFLARQGKFIVRIDANGPVPGLRGKYFDQIEPRWYKGPIQPRLGDLAYTQFAMCGGRRSYFSNNYLPKSESPEDGASAPSVVLR